MLFLLRYPGGGVLSEQDGRIYAMPHSIKQILCIDTDSESVSFIGREVESVHSNSCIVLGKGGVMYGFHRFKNNRILRTSPALVSHFAPLLEQYPKALGMYGLSGSQDKCKMTLEYMHKILAQAVDPESPSSLEVKKIREAVKMLGDIATNQVVCCSFIY